MCRYPEGRVSGKLHNAVEGDAFQVKELDAATPCTLKRTRPLTHALVRTPMRTHPLTRAL